MAKKPPTIRKLTTETLPPRPPAATTDRPVSQEARRIISAAQVEAIRRAQNR
jgi:hypothetical protein